MKKLICFGIIILFCITLVSASLSDSLNSVQIQEKECNIGYIECRICYNYPFEIGNITKNLKSCIFVDEISTSENNEIEVKRAVERDFRKIYFQVFNEEYTEIPEEPSLEILINETNSSESITEVLSEIPSEPEFPEDPLPIENQTETNQTIENLTDLNQVENISIENVTEPNQTIIEIIIQNVTNLIENLTGNFTEEIVETNQTI